MKKLQGFLSILGVIVKYAGVAMVLIETIEFFNERLKEKLGSIEVEPKEEKDVKLSE